MTIYFNRWVWFFLCFSFVVSDDVFDDMFITSEVKAIFDKCYETWSTVTNRMNYEATYTTECDLHYACREKNHPLYNATHCGIELCYDTVYGTQSKSTCEKENIPMYFPSYMTFRDKCIDKYDDEHYKVHCMDGNVEIIFYVKGRQDETNIFETMPEEILFEEMPILSSHMIAPEFHPDALPLEIITIFEQCYKVNQYIKGYGMDELYIYTFEEIRECSYDHVCSNESHILHPYVTCGAHICYKLDENPKSTCKYVNVPIYFPHSIRPRRECVNMLTWSVDCFLNDGHMLTFISVGAEHEIFMIPDSILFEMVDWSEITGRPRLTKILEEEIKDVSESPLTFQQIVDDCKDAPKPTECYNYYQAVHGFDIIAARNEECGKWGRPELCYDHYSGLYKLYINDLSNMRVSEALKQKHQMFLKNSEVVLVGDVDIKDAFGVSVAFQKILQKCRKYEDPPSCYVYHQENYVVDLIESYLGACFRNWESEELCYEHYYNVYGFRATDLGFLSADKPLIKKRVSAQNVIRNAAQKTILKAAAEKFTLKDVIITYRVKRPWINIVETIFTFCLRWIMPFAFMGLVIFYPLFEMVGYIVRYFFLPKEEKTKEETILVLSAIGLLVLVAAIIFQIDFETIFLVVFEFLFFFIEMIMQIVLFFLTVVLNVVLKLLLYIAYGLNYVSILLYGKEVQDIPLEEE